MTNPPDDRLAFLRAQRDDAPDAATRAMFEALIAALEAAQPRVHTQAIDAGAQVGVAVAGDVHGGIHVVTPTPSVTERLVRARNSLAVQNYQAAQDECALVLQAEPANAHARLFAALALLGGDYADRIELPAMQRIEAHVFAATEHPALAATAWAMLAILKTDFDTNRQQRTFRHTLAQIKHSLKGAGTAQIDHELLAFVRTTERTRREILS